MLGAKLVKDMFREKRARGQDKHRDLVKQLDRGNQRAGDGGKSTPGSQRRVIESLEWSFGIPD
jgi:hypothetical protein